MIEINVKKGFIALISVIIVSGILILVAITLSLEGFNTRNNILDSEMKERGANLAEACVDNTILKIINDPDFFGNSTTTIADGNCFVGFITTTLGVKTFKTRVNYKNFYTNFKISINSSDFSVISWEEISGP